MDDADGRTLDLETYDLPDDAGYEVLTTDTAGAVRTYRVEPYGDRSVTVTNSGRSSCGGGEAPVSNTKNGKYVAGISAAKNHLTFSAWSPRIIEDFGVRLTGFMVKKNCFHIPVDWEIDGNLLADLVRARLAELDQEIT